MAHDEPQSTYSAKLRDPRWQKLRLQVMERDEWACQSCFDSASTLAVHHRYYVPGKEPWEYPLNALVTLCESCHETETVERRGAERQLLFALRKAGFFSAQVQELAEAFSCVDETPYKMGAGILAAQLALALRDPLIQGMLCEWYFDYLARERHGVDSEEYQQQHEERMARLRGWEEAYHQRPQDDGPAYPRLRALRAKKRRKKGHAERICPPCRHN
jgi:hypothetical protein